MNAHTTQNAHSARRAQLSFEVTKCEKSSRRKKRLFSLRILVTSFKLKNKRRYDMPSTNWHTTENPIAVIIDSDILSCFNVFSAGHK